MIEAAPEAQAIVARRAASGPPAPRRPAATASAAARPALPTRRRLGEPGRRRRSAALHAGRARSVRLVRRRRSAASRAAGLAPASPASPISARQSKANGVAQLGEPAGDQADTSNPPARAVCRPCQPHDIEPVLGPRQRDIEQAALLLRIQRPPVARARLARRGYRRTRCAATTAAACRRPRRRSSSRRRPCDAAVCIVSGRKTIGACRPLAPCTVMMRTWPPVSWSRSRLISTRAAAQPLQEALQRRHVVALIGERQGEELVDRIGGIRAQPRRAAPGARRAVRADRHRAR